jgi:hypothetical protein
MHKFALKRYAKIIMTAAAVLALCAFRAAPVFGAGEVALIKAGSMLMKDTVRLDSAGGDTTYIQQIKFLILIKNIAFEKRVSVWVKNDSAWDSLPCSWVRQADDDNEYWDRSDEFSYADGRMPRDLEFKIMYVEGIHTYWDDNGGRNFRLARNGGSLLNKVNVQLRDAQWARDTGLAIDSSVFSGSVEVRGYREGSDLRVSFTKDNLATQDIRTAAGPPEPTWRGAPPADDSDKVWLYRFSFAGVALPFEQNPTLHFHLNFSDGISSWKDDNRAHSYAMRLGAKLAELRYEDLPIPAALRYPGRTKAAARNARALLKPGSVPMFTTGSRRVDGIGRSR